jgi:hypothetical protein
VPIVQFLLLSNAYFKNPHFSRKTKRRKKFFLFLQHTILCVAWTEVAAMSSSYLPEIVLTLAQRETTQGMRSNKHEKLF